MGKPAVPAMLLMSVFILVACEATDSDVKCPQTGAFKGLQCYAHTAQGLECEKHMWLAKCLGKSIVACRKCGTGFTSRCGKPALRNLCHFHYHGAQTHNKKHVAAVLAATMPTAQDKDEDIHISSADSREEILKKLALMKAKIQDNVDLIKEKQKRKAEKIALGMKAKKTRAPTVVPTKSPTTILQSEYAKSHNTANVNKGDQEGDSLWKELSPKPASAGNSRHSKIAKSGEYMCEEHGYNKKKCQSVGCCTFLSGLCWSAVGSNPCLKRNEKPAKKVPVGEEGEALDKEAFAGRSAEATAAKKTGATTGQAMCEEHGYNKIECHSVGCCAFTSGLCWSAVGTKSCASAKKHKHSWEQRHQHGKHKKKKKADVVDFTPYPTPPPTRATPAPTKAPTPQYDEDSEEAESAIEDRIFAANKKAKVAAAAKIAAKRASLQKGKKADGVSDVSSMRTRVAQARGVGGDQACDMIKQKANTVCDNVYGQGAHCVKVCESKISQDESLAPYLSKCLFEWKKGVQEKICWPSDCKATVDYFCKDFYGYGVKGTMHGKTHIYGLCDLCMWHYTEMSPPVKHSSCWRAQVSSICPKELKNIFGTPTKITIQNINEVIRGIKKSDIPKFKQIRSS